MVTYKKKGKKTIWFACTLGITFLAMVLIGKKKKKDYVYENDVDQQNPVKGKKVVFVHDENASENADGVRGHLKVVGNSSYSLTFYTKYVKRALDIILSFCGLVVLSPLYATIALAIVIEDPGPVFFTQKRI